MMTPMPHSISNQADNINNEGPAAKKKPTSKSSVEHHIETKDDGLMDYEVEVPTADVTSTIATSSVSTFQPQHHHEPAQQQTVSIFPPDSTMTEDDQTMEQDDVDNDNDIEDSPSMVGDGDEHEADDEEDECPEPRASSATLGHNLGSQPILPSRSPAPESKAHLVVDTSVVNIHSSTPDRSTSSMTSTTPTTTPFTPDTGSTPSTATGTTAPSSRRSSLRTATATLPRSALQEETINLFKQFRNLIPCAKCFCRNTIQRDGMSDGNLRFKCRPPVSMSLICNKSYSESKIRNMIAGVVYGHSLPDSGTPTSASSGSPSSANVLAMAPPPSLKGSRRPSHKLGDGNTLGRLKEEQALDSNQEDGYDEMNLNADHRNSFRAIRRRPSSMNGEDSPNVDYDGAAMPPPPHPGQGQESGAHQDREDARHYRPPGPYAMAKHGQKLHYSQSHPNIGQQRRQHSLEQHQHQNQFYHSQQQQQQRHFQRQVLRRESTQPQSMVHRPELERRFSHPAALQSHGQGGRYLPVSQSGDPLSPALSSSSRSSPGRESQQGPSGSQSQGADQSTTPVLRALPAGRYDEQNTSSPFYQRRMSQPVPISHRSYGPLPPSGMSSSHFYDRRQSEADEYNQQHREKYERLNASTFHSSGSSSTRYHQKVKPQERSPLIPHSALPSSRSPHPLDHPSDRTSPRQQDSHPATFKSLDVKGLQSEPMRFSHSMPASSGAGGPRHAYQTSQDQRSSIHYQLPRRGDGVVAPDQDPSLMGFENRSNARPGFHRSDQGPFGRVGDSLVHVGSQDLNSVMPRNTIKLTCFPSTTSSSALPPTRSMNTSDALAMQLSKSSKVVIEITQPRSLQSYRTPTTKDDDPRDPGSFPRPLRHTVSQPNMQLQRSGTSILGSRTRRSVSPDSMSFGSSKKRRADSLSGVRDDMDSDEAADSKSAETGPNVASAQAAAAAVIAAAANATASADADAGLQVVGLNYVSPSKEQSSSKYLQVPGLTTTGADSPTLEALQVARASSYVLLEDQKELGIDYSAFTRVETAGWRILIPPTVVASFRSEDFGLMLKPKSASDIDQVMNSTADEPAKEMSASDIDQVMNSTADEPAKEIAMAEQQETGEAVQTQDEKLGEVKIGQEETSRPSGQQHSMEVESQSPDVKVDEEEMDELEED
ncbi:hypothetical protein EMPS_07729 [Entomortierella parvispora]|uniref:Uncharacterized protein n=1 Tax=Entomortierella parvispora TaxID=205924 RepID=A0A9P3LYF0_9FUNG|nr:hypothetical protein EMPS_07729 [Entomortierella parvispora]